MKLISWNVRGLGSTLKRNAVRKLVRQERVDLLMLQETKLEEVNNSLFKQLWGQEVCEGQWVASSGRSGGIIMLWRPG